MPYKANTAKRPIKRILSNAVYSEYSKMPYKANSAKRPIKRIW